MRPQRRYFSKRLSWASTQLRSCRYSWDRRLGSSLTFCRSEIWPLPDRPRPLRYDSECCREIIPDFTGRPAVQLQTTNRRKRFSWILISRRQRAPFQWRHVLGETTVYSSDLWRQQFLGSASPVWRF